MGHVGRRPCGPWAVRAVGRAGHGPCRPWAMWAIGREHPPASCVSGRAELIEGGKIEYGRVRHLYSHGPKVMA